MANENDFADVDSPEFPYALTIEGAYTPAEKGSWQDGQQMEPDDDSYFDVYHVWLLKVDITELLTPKFIRELGELACTSLEADADARA